MEKGGAQPGACTYLLKERMQTMFQNKWFYLFCISMLPIVELRGGIPAGAAMGLPFWPVYLTCVLGNLLPVPFLILFAKRYWSFSLLCPVSAGSSRKSSAGRTKKRPKSVITKMGAVPLCSHSAAGHRRLDRFTGGGGAADAYLAGIPGHHGRGTGQRIHHRRDRLRAVHRAGIIQ